ncbi:hypothetical protein I79_022680 [Cricetulus griseus]|uniref:Uncharacterized protein n=1 Tax=Cricetulus griseus TaxID=10029 RepID=G3IG03_CRIGR|nr:hypothetical protein I79_022680 [Cricetulus griseus]
MQAEVMLKELLHVDMQAAGSRQSVTEQNLRKGDLKAHILPPTKPQLLVVPLPLGAIFCQTTQT